METVSNIALSQLMALKDQMDVVANNVANMNTTGYKEMEMKIGAQKVTATAPGISPSVNGSYSAIIPLGIHRDTRGGVITPTGNPLDVAIQGAGYFSVQTPNGDTRYTRNGVFQINDGGQLVDLNGNAVQGSSGEINIPKGTTSITIGQDGTVSTPKAILGQIGLTTFANEQSLQPDGNNYLTASADADPQPATNPRMLQGSIESSNVNTVKSMTQMIEVQRQYQSAANLVQQEQDRTTNAIKDLAKIN